MIKKLIISSLVLGIFSSTLLAEDNGVYIGADIGNTSVDIKMSADGYDSENTSDDGGSQTLKVGYYFDSNSRAYLAYQNVNVEEGSSGITTLGYDYLIGTEKFKPYIGAIVGYGSLTSDDDTVDITGMVYGAQLGANYAFTENISAEIGYRYLLTDMSDTVDSYGTNVNIEVENAGNYYLGINYKF